MGMYFPFVAKTYVTSGTQHRLDNSLILCSKDTIAQPLEVQYFFGVLHYSTVT